MNVASDCGRTKENYEQLSELVHSMGSRGLKVLVFPCNQFGEQEPGTNEEIQQFLKETYPKSLEQLIFFTKGDVNGDETRPIYQYLKPIVANSDGTTDIQWNFGKSFLCFLVEVRYK